MKENNKTADIEKRILLHLYELSKVIKHSSESELKKESGAGSYDELVTVLKGLTDKGCLDGIKFDDSMDVMLDLDEKLLYTTISKAGIKYLKKISLGFRLKMIGEGLLDFIGTIGEWIRICLI